MDGEERRLAPWSLRPARLRWRAGLGIGAAALVGSFYVGTADITIAANMGSIFGFEMWWTYWVLGIAGWAMMDMSVRYFLRFRRTPLSMFKEMHPILSLYLFVTIVVTTIVGAYSQWNACAHVLSGLFPVLPAEAAGAMACTAAVAALLWGMYQRLEILFAVALIALIGLFAAAAIAANAPWTDALAGCVPTVPSEKRDVWFRLIQSNAGSLINAWLILIYPYTMLEKGWYSDRTSEKETILKRARLDYGIGIAAAGIVALPIMAAAAAVARPFGIVPSNYTEFAAMLEPAAGSTATVLFLVGLFLAAWTAGIGWLVCGAYAILDFGNLQLRMRSRGFRTAVFIFAAFSAAILFLRVNPFDGIKIFAAFLAVVFPVLALAMVWRVSRPDMGYFQWFRGNRRGLTVCVVDLFALIVSLAVGWGMMSKFLGW